MQSSFQNLARTIGNIFLPIVATVLPYINALVNALQRLAEFIVKLLGFEGFEWGGFGGSSDVMSDIYDDAEGVNDAIGGASDKAKKLKKNLLGIDELNIISNKDEGAGAGGGGMIESASLLKDALDKILDEYQKTWDEAYENMENRTNEFANNVSKAYEENGLFGVGRYLSDSITETLEKIPWDKVYEGATNFGTGLAEFLNGFISPKLFSSVGKTIANSLNAAIKAALAFGGTFDWENLGESIAAGVNSFFENFNFAEFAQTINVWVQGIWTTITTAIKKIKWDLVWEKAKEFLSNIELDTVLIALGLLAISKIAGLIFKFNFGEWFSKTFLSLIPEISLDIGSKISLAISSLEGLSPVVLGLSAAIAILVAGLTVAYAKNEEVRKSFHEAASAIADNFKPALELVTKTIIPDLQKGWQKLKETLTPLANFLSGVFVSIWQDMINPALMFIGKTVLPMLITTFENLWNKVLVPFGNFLFSVLNPVIEFLSGLLTMLWQNIIVPLAEFIGTVFAGAFELIYTLVNEQIIPGIQSVIEIFQFLWEEVWQPIIDWLVTYFKPMFENVIETMGSYVKDLSDIFSGLIEFLLGVFTKDWTRAWEGIKDIFKGVFNAIADIFSGIINFIIDGINGFLSGFNGIANAIGDVIGVNINIPEIQHVVIPKFEQGGFPKESSLFWANEFGVPELVGSIGGRTAVANNDQIIYGIQNGVKEAVQEVLSPYLASIASNTSEMARKNTTIEIDGRELANAVNSRNARNGYSFT